MGLQEVDKSQLLNHHHHLPISRQAAFHFLDSFLCMHKSFKILIKSSSLVHPTFLFKQHFCCCPLGVWCYIQAVIHEHCYSQEQVTLYSCYTSIGEDGILAGPLGEFNLPSSKFLNRDAKEQVRVVSARSYLRKAYSTIAFLFSQTYFSLCF